MELTDVVEGRVPIPVPCIRVGPVPEEQPHTLEVPALGGIVERGSADDFTGPPQPAYRAPHHVWGLPLLQQALEKGMVAFRSRLVELVSPVNL